MQSKTQQQQKQTYKIEKSDYEQNGWKFKGQKFGILPSNDLLTWTTQLQLNHIPDIVFGDNLFQIINEKYGFIFEINPRDSLKFCNYSVRNNRLIQQPYQKSIQFNTINVIPSEVKVKFAQIWKQRQVSQDVMNEIKIVEQISDSFYSSPYKGTIKNLTTKDKEQEEAYDKELQQKIDLKTFNMTEVPKGSFYAEYTTDQIPVENLTEKNQIVWSYMISLWEDELGDNGLTSSDFRFRVMKDCFFGLIRHYLRVDDVIIRIYDTRIYHDFNWNYILREFSVREDSYQGIYQTGFKFTPQWIIDPNQSFQIQNNVQKKFYYSEKIYFANSINQ